MPQVLLKDDPSMLGRPPDSSRRRRLRRFLVGGLAAIGLGAAAGLVTGAAQVIKDPLGLVSIGTTPADNTSAWIAVSNGGTASSTPLPAGPACSIQPYNGASICWEGLSASTTGSAYSSPFGAGISGTGCASGYAAVSILGCTTGYSLVAVSGTGCANGFIAVGGGCASSPYGSAGAVAVTGCASGGGVVMVSVLGCANQDGSQSGMAISGTGNAQSAPGSGTQIAVSGTGSATGMETVSGTGPSSNGDTAAITLGMGSASSQELAISGLGSAKACGGPFPLAVSGTFNTQPC